MLLICSDSAVKYFCPLTGDRRNEARERNTLHDPSLFSFHDLIRQVSSCVMKVDGLNVVNVGVEGVSMHRPASGCGSRQLR